VCLALYLIADRPLASIDSDALVVAPLHELRWGKPVVPGDHVYRFGPPGCACSLLRDGEDEKSDGERERQLDAAVDYLEQICLAGPVTALVSWMGDERKEAGSAETTPAGFRHFNFDTAWERPTRVNISAGA